VPNLSGAILLSDSEIDEPSSHTISISDLVRLFWLASGPHHYLVNKVRWRRGLPGVSGELQRSMISRRPSRLAISLFAALLPALEDSVQRRRAIAGHYRKRTGESKYLIPQQVSADREPSWFNFSVRLLPEIAHVRDALLIALRRRGIFGDRLWHDSPVAINLFQDYLKDDCPNARLLAGSVLNLPIKAGYRESDIDRLFDLIEQTIQELV
jgi:dTDP-4-amino-4,6-dideoxygalactose transaminase